MRQREPPGVVSEKLTPDQARRKVIAVANEVPQLSVLGIAGPGDACYDWKKSQATFSAIAKDIPDIKLCISTNGLALPDRVDELADMNVDHVTITINMVDPEIGAKIYPWIYFRNRRWTGVEASQILHERQMLGLEMLTARGVLTKINSVMIPGINDEHLIEVNRWVKAARRLPAQRDAAHFRSRARHAFRPDRPARPERDGAQGAAGQARRRRQADAPLPPVPRRRGRAARRGSRPGVHARPVAGGGRLRSGQARGLSRNRRRASAATMSRPRKAAAAAIQENAAEGQSMLVAVATKGGGRVNEHFGHAKEFQIYEASSKGVVFVGHRKVEAYCMGGFGEDATLDAVIAALEGVRHVLCAKIGDCPKDMLEAAGIEASDAYAYEYAETAIGALYAQTFARAPGRAVA